MRKILAAALLLVASMAYAELGTRTVSVTAGSQTITIGYDTLTIVNDGSNEVYVRIFAGGEATGDATTSSAQIKSGEGFTFYRQGQINSISIVCAASETATVRLFYW